MITYTRQNYLKYRRTKILATLGPSSNDQATIENLIKAGVNVFRLNMSHGTQKDHTASFLKVHRAAKHLKKEIAVLADLCGPKIRAGTFPSGKVELTTGEDVIVTCREIEGAPGLIPSQYKQLAHDVKVGNQILLDDGNIELRVKSVLADDITCEVINGGMLSDHKGINLPDVEVSTSSLTDQDRVDAQFAVELGVDYLALSFVRKGSDVIDLRKLISTTHSHVGIIAKIEKPEALENIDDILQSADGIMVARGDLGVEMPPQIVPNAQDELIELARATRKPVIVATQMLESMISHPRPTRAEVTDVANAVRHGVDGIMLSAETAAGDYPVKAVEMMDSISRQTELFQSQRGAFAGLTSPISAVNQLPIEDALSDSIAYLSRELDVKAIVVLSVNDHSLAVVSSSRPAAPVVGICHDARSARIANLLWGVIPVTADLGNVDDLPLLAKHIAVENDLASEGDVILLLSGFSTNPLKNIPSVTILRV